MHIVLASTSQYRAELLERLGLTFTASAPRISEARQPGEPAAALVRRLAREKALAVAASCEDALVIGSDQLAVQGEETLGKPGTAENARAQLARLSGREVRFLTGLALVNSREGSIEDAVIETPVSFRELSAAQIARYVELESPLDCAGAFKSEGLGITLFTAIGGEDPTALIGLPLIELCSMLQRQDYDVLGAPRPSS